MKTISWMSQEQCLIYVQEKPETYVISIADKHRAGDATLKVRGAAKNLFIMNVNLDDMGSYDVTELAAWLLSIPEDAELVVHCTEGRYRSRYLVEVIEMAWGRTFDDFIEFNEVRSQYNHIDRDDIFKIIRPLLVKMEEHFEAHVAAKENKDGEVETAEATGS